jgi:ribosomal protein S18 acetylase RimI-like enzyme
MAQSSFEAIQGGIELLDQVKPLWEQLNRHHELNASHHRSHFSHFTFEKRKKGLLEKRESHAFFIEIIRSGGDAVAYCISTSDGRKGEVESIFIEKDQRGEGLGDQLMKNAMMWMDAQGAQDRVIMVAAGNEQVWPFYERYGFFPYATKLRNKPDQ